MELTANRNVNELVDFIVAQPETATMVTAIQGYIVPTRKAVAWANFAAQMARRYMLINGLTPDNFVMGEIYLAAVILDDYYQNVNPLAKFTLV